jgi:hypothetical protein
MDVLMTRHSGTWHQCIVSHTITCLWAKNSEEVLQMEHSGKWTQTSIALLLHINLSMYKHCSNLCHYFPRPNIANYDLWYRYPIYGGMQDWNYIHGGCFELTLEISDVKWPRASEVFLHLVIYASALARYTFFLLWSSLRSSATASCHMETK